MIPDPDRVVEVVVEPPAPGVPSLGVPSLGVAAAARRFGVAPATMRTWDRRYGIGPTEHTPGRHRRYSPDDVARLELMAHALARGATPADAAGYALATRLRPPPAAAPAPPDAAARDTMATGTGRVDRARADGADRDGTAEQIRVGGGVLRLPGAGRQARGLGRAALALDAVTVRAVLAESIAASGVAATWDRVTRPVLAAVAQLWVDTGEGIEVEHLLSECVIAVFLAVAAATPTTGAARPVLLAGMPTEQHTLPMVVLAASLAQDGVSCRSLGPDLPAAALVTAIRRTAPAAVVLWSQLAATADPRVLRSLPRTRPGFRTFVAGPGWSGVALPPTVVALVSLSGAVAAIGMAVRP